jgi:hypothetical protein
MRRSLSTTLIAGAVTAWTLALGCTAAARPAKTADSAACARDHPCQAAGPAPNYRALRLAVEAELRTKLSDPDSAYFQWPLGFAYGSWRPTIVPHMTGYLGCGMVNVKNRFGSDAGIKWFSAIVGDDGKVKLAHIDNIGGLAQAKPYCARAGLPRPQVGMLDVALTPAQSGETLAPSAVALAPKADQPVSIPAELARLAALRDQGVLSDPEFQVLEQALLRHHISPP